MDKKNREEVANLEREKLELEVAKQALDVLVKVNNLINDNKLSGEEKNLLRKLKSAAIAKIENLKMTNSFSLEKAWEKIEVGL